MAQAFERGQSLGAPAGHRQGVSQLALDFRDPPERIERRSQSRDSLGMHALLQVRPGRIALRLRKRRVQLQRLAKLLDGLIVLARVEIVPAEMNADDQLQRFQFERALALGQRLLCPSERKETV